MEYIDTRGGNGQLYYSLADHFIVVASLEATELISYYNEGSLLQLTEINLLLNTINK